MNHPVDRPAQEPLALAPSGLLPAALRRDLADLNAQYLELGLTPGLERDPRFGWSEPVRRCLAAAEPGTRDRIAAAPFALFGLLLVPAGAATVAPRVEDGRMEGVPVGWQGRYESFAHQAVFLARRLHEAEPMALHLVLGLSGEAQHALADCRLARLAEMAGSPRLIRPRWRLHSRFWEMLSAAARRGTPAALQWAHCVGLCLLGADDGEVAPAPPRRRPRR